MNRIESALLSCISQDPAVIGSEVLATFQHTNPFQDDVCRRVYHAFATQSDRTKWNSVAIIEKLEKSVYEADWYSEVRAIQNAVPHTLDWRTYLSAVIEADNKRKVQTLLEGALHNMKDTESVQELCQGLTRELSNVGTQGDVGEVDINEEVQAEIDRLARGEEYSTGIPAIDEIIGPLSPGEVFTIAASTGVGKSLLAVNIVRYMSVIQGLPGVYFSFEMGPAKHVARIAASLTHHNSKEVLPLYRDGNEEVVSAYNRVMQSPVFWDKRPRLAPAQVCNKVRRLAVTEGIKYAIIDTLDFIKMDKRVRKNEAIGDFYKDFKAVCTENGVIPIVLVQINRSSKESETGPGLHHLKDSSSIEQDSSQVLILDREITLTQEERGRVSRGEPIPLKAAGAKSRYDMTGYEQLALFLHSSLIQDKAYDASEY